jgi:Tol biopolymer transport system component
LRNLGAAAVYNCWLKKQGVKTVNRVFAGIIPFFLLGWTACSCSVHKTGDYKIAVVPAARGQYGIFVMNADTTGGKLLTPDPGAQLEATSWSPDGQKIVFFSARSQDSDILSKYPMPFHYPLYEIGAAGGTQKRLLEFPVSSSTWSPDSTELLFVSAYEDPEHADEAVIKGTKVPLSAIYILNLRTGKQRRLTEFGRNCSGDWSPDGTQLALSFGTEQSSDIYVVSLTGKHRSRLTDSKSICTRPAWSPDGRHIVYIAASSPEAEDSAAGVFVTDSTGANKKRISDMTAFSVSWSPDSKRILLQTGSGLMLTDIEGNNSINPAPGIGRPLDALFTPDGREIIFRSNHEGEWRLYATELNGTGLRKITGKLSASTFCLSPLQSKP